MFGFYILYFLNVFKFKNNIMIYIIMLWLLRAIRDCERNHMEGGILRDIEYAREYEKNKNCTTEKKPTIVGKSPRDPHETSNDNFIKFQWPWTF